MKIILNDIVCKENLYPFTLTRSAADIRIGILTIREKWETLLGKKIYTISEIAEKENEDVKLIPANIIPSHKWLKEWKHNEVFDSPKFNPIKIEYPWHIFQNNDLAIREDFDLITRKRKSKKISSTNTVIGKNIFLEEGATVKHSILNASYGPIYIGENAKVMEGCTIRGSFAMCEGSILKMGAKVYGATTLGPYCIAAGEIKNSILFGYSNKSHDGYLGDSVIGEWCNLGAGTSNSNIKNTAGNVKIWNDFKKEYISAGFKCGLLMGDYSRAAINTSFNTGTVVGVASNVFCNGFPPTFIESFSWGNKKYELEKALEHIENWKKLKGHIISEEEKKNIIRYLSSKKIIMRKQIAAANWKMNLTLKQGIKLTDDLLSENIELQDHQEVIFGVPFPYLIPVKEKIKDSPNYFVAAQNCYFQKSGAYTGEVSSEMLKSVRTDYVIIGHSERREYFNENHQMLAEKINLCFENNLKPIFCCGEPLPVRESEEQNSYVEDQLKESLFHLSAEQLTGFVIAYEPIWAIGTGKTASSAQAQEMHAHIRNIIANKYNKEVAESISILYGGSVKANNAKEIFSEKDVDGGLVGGASLVASEFVQIIKSLR